MASTKAISRSKGQSAVASASYRAGVVLKDNRYGKTHNYSKRAGVMSADIIVPSSLANTVIDRAELWNLAEETETRKNSRVAREWLINLPHELDEKTRKELAHEFTQALVDRFGTIADCAIHRPTKKEIERGADARNFHAHIMLTTRKAELDDNGKVKLTDKADCELSDTQRKIAGLSRARAEVTEIRELWEALANNKLLMFGHELIDSRSYEKQGIDIQPQLKIGPIATKLERDKYERELIKAERAQENGKRYKIDKTPATQRGLINEMIKERNELIFNIELEHNRQINDKAEEIIFSKEKQNGKIIERLNISKRAINNSKPTITATKQKIDAAEQYITNIESIINKADKYLSRVSKQINATERRLNFSQQQSEQTNRAINTAIQLDNESKHRALLISEKFIEAYIAINFEDRLGAKATAIATTIVNTFDYRQKRTIQSFSKSFGLEFDNSTNLEQFEYKVRCFFKNNLNKSEVRDISNILISPSNERLKNAKDSSFESQALSNSKNIVSPSEASDRPGIDFYKIEPPSPF